MEIFAWIVLPALLGVNIFMLRKNPQQFNIFKTIYSTRGRQRVFRLLLIQSFLFYGLGSVVLLALVGHFADLYQFPPFFEEPSQRLLRWGNADDRLPQKISGWLLTAMVPFFLVGTTVITFLEVYLLARKGKRKYTRMPTGKKNVEYLLPRNAQERFWTALLALNAGFSEELFFRLLLPVLFYIVSGSVTMAIVAPLLWFALGHFYQGLPGILITGLMGAAMLLMYLYTRNIWLVMLMHAVLDLNSLLYGPWLEERLFHSRKSLPKKIQME